MPGLPRRNGTRPGRRYAALAGILLAVNVLWNVRGGAPLVAFPHAPSWPSLRIVEVRPELAADGLTMTVQVDVWNSSSEPRSGRVWWQLSHPSGEGGAWDRRVYDSAFVGVNLDPGEQDRFSWTEPAAVPSGRYHVDAWAEVRHDEELVPSDGRSSQETVTIDHDPARLLRRGPPRAGVSVVQPDDLVSRRGLDVRLSNHVSEKRTGWLYWTLTETGQRPLHDWWRWAGAKAKGRTKHVVIPAHSQLDVRLGDLPALAPGTYALRVTLGFDQPAKPQLAPWPDEDVLVLIGSEVAPH